MPKQLVYQEMAFTLISRRVK